MSILGIVTGALGIKFQNLTPALALSLGLKLAGVVPELLNLPADHHISEEGRLKIEDAIAEFEKEVNL
ncbi:hypothetical protein Q0M94_28575 (plasmid) [Deinococcus radiomollis]|uniref:hypothetical protein n=1 Tax=Deinococcus radiomollis TaxID=468916 RepID=UPI003891C0CB